MPAVVAAVGLLLMAAGGILLTDFAGAARAVIRRVTSRSLGSLAPGYAADPRGRRLYAVLQRPWAWRGWVWRSLPSAQSPPHSRS